MTDSRSVNDFSEEQLIARIREFLTMTPDIELGPGDDAAIVRAADGRFVVSTDVLVEGRHFLRDRISAPDLGRRALAQNLADIAAMGARPTAIVVALTLAPDVPVTWIDGLALGMGEAARVAGAAVAGGDLVRGSEISIAVTVMGSLDAAAPVLRSGARPGDIIAHAGRVGWSAAGLALLDAGVEDYGAPFIAAHRVPEPPLAAGVAAQRAGASAMLDVSDGLLRDADRIARASGVVLDIDAEAVSGWAEPLHGAAEQVGADARTWVLSGGEDHGLLATFPPDVALPDSFTEIGKVLEIAGGPDSREGPGVVISGQPVQLPPGWDHFAG